VQQIIGVSLSEASPVDWGPLVKLATTYGVLNDAITHSSDLKAIGTDDKSMFWINETTSRWDGHM
jgi:uncharacterized protein